MVIKSANLRGEIDQQAQLRAQDDASTALEVPKGSVTELQLRANQSHRGVVYPPNAPEFFATQALGLSANAGKVSNAVAKITKDGFDKPAGDEQLAGAIVSAAAMSIVHAMLIIDEMGYSVEDVVNGVL